MEIPVNKTGLVVSGRFINQSIRTGNKAA